MNSEVVENGVQKGEHNPGQHAIKGQQGEGASIAEVGTVQNLCKINNLTEDVLVDHLAKRYARDEIYTYVGDILIALNPFKHLKIYSQKTHDKYYTVATLASHAPHIFAIGSQVFTNMREQGRAQCCIISGESGAGKTESTKLLVKHILTLSGSKVQSLSDQIHQLNPILEAFGNAQTTMNDNSSRFGKFLELLFEENGMVFGACISHYLLEKPRVVHCEEGEANFHVFYYMLHGMPDEMRAKFSLSKDFNYRYLPVNTIPHFQRAQDKSTCDKNQMTVLYTELIGALEDVGFEADEISNLHSILAGIIHTGDITFGEDPNSTSGASMVSSKSVVAIVAHLFDVSEGDLAAAFTTAVSVTRGETIARENSVEQAEATRDAMSMAIYGHLFEWMILELNLSLSPDNTASLYRNDIGILDIFGFENFQQNGFEQLLINIANEQLQYFFNQHIFVLEMKDYEANGLDLGTFTFPNNQDTLDMLLGRRTGIVAILDEECYFPRANDLTFCEKLHASLESNDNYIAPKNKGAQFTVKHYAADVTYEAEGFLAKNRDHLAEDIARTLRQSANPLLKKLFAVEKKFKREDVRTTIKRRKTSIRRKMLPAAEAAKAKKNELEKNKKSLKPKKIKTICGFFKDSLTDLMAKMHDGQPWFIRCVKPNKDKAPNQLDPKFVETQLRYSGVMETVRIRREGFPIRIQFGRFIADFGLKVFPPGHVEVTKENVQKIVDHLGVKGILIGTDKVFLRHDQNDQLIAIRYKYTSKAEIIQRYVRGWTARRRYQTLQKQRTYEEYQANDFMEFVEKTSAKTSVRVMGQVGLGKAHIERKLLPPPPPSLTDPPAPKSDDDLYSLPVKQRKNTLSACSKPEDFSFLKDTGVSLSVQYNERSVSIAQFDVHTPKLIVDACPPREIDGEGHISITRLSNPERDGKTDKIRGFVGKGIRVRVDKNLNAYCQRLGKNPVFFKNLPVGTVVMTPEELPESGLLPVGDEIKIFDFELFKEKVDAMDSVRDKLPYTSLKFSFVRNHVDERKTPCWFKVFLADALRYAKGMEMTKEWFPSN